MKLIALADEAWGIGLGGEQIVTIPDDLKRFKALTTGKTVVMGRVTFEGLPGGKPLPGRRNIVMTTQAGFKPGGGAEICASEAQLLRMTAGTRGDDIFVIGGEAIYRLLLDRCDAAYVTRVLARFEADRHMPDLDAAADWKPAGCGPILEHDGLKYRYCEYLKGAREK